MKGRCKIPRVHVAGPTVPLDAATQTLKSKQALMVSQSDHKRLKRLALAAQTMSATFLLRSLSSGNLPVAFLE